MPYFATEPEKVSPCITTMSVWEGLVVLAAGKLITLGGAVLASVLMHYLYRESSTVSADIRLNINPAALFAKSADYGSPAVAGQPDEMSARPPLLSVEYLF